MQTNAEKRIIARNATVGLNALQKKFVSYSVQGSNIATRGTFLHRLVAAGRMVSTTSTLSAVVFLRGKDSALKDSCNHVTNDVISSTMPGGDVANLFHACSPRYTHLNSCFGLFQETNIVRICLSSQLYLTPHIRKKIICCNAYIREISGQ